MKFTRLLAIVGLSFAAGAWLSPRGGSETLRAALRSGPRISLSAALPAQDAGAHEERTIQERFGQVLSALQERSPLKRQHDLAEALGDLTGAELATLIEGVPRFPSAMHYQLTMALLDRWFDVDPDQAKAWVRARPRDQHYWKVWAAKSPGSFQISQCVIPC